MVQTPVAFLIQGAPYMLGLSIDASLVSEFLLKGGKNFKNWKRGKRGPIYEEGPVHSFDTKISA